MRSVARKTGVVTDVIPEGGHQDPRAHEGMHLTQSISRAPARCMYPDEFVATLRTHKHPRWPTIGIACSRVANQQRESETLFGSSGTVYVANVHQIRDLFVVPCDCLPYTSIKTATWNEERTRWENGEIVRGWRQALTSLIQTTYLEPSRELSWLVGEDTFKLFPIEARP